MNVSNFKESMFVNLLNYGNETRDQFYVILNFVLNGKLLNSGLMFIRNLTILGLLCVFFLVWAEWMDLLERC